MASATDLAADDRVLVITRIFDAPRELVWRAWTDPELAIRWYGPRDYPGTYIEGDLRPGGKWRGCLRGTATGEELWQGGVYREIVPNERLVFTFAWDEEGERGQEMLVTLTFEDAGEDAGAGKTRFTLRQEVFASVEERDGHNYGWNSTFDRLQDVLQTIA
jgi:uncharacterized protein YndB with AHSA1/START domain